MGKPLSMNLRLRGWPRGRRGKLPGCGEAVRGVGLYCDLLHDQRRSTGGYAAKRKAATRVRAGSKLAGTRFWLCATHAAISRCTSYGAN